MAKYFNDIEKSLIVNYGVFLTIKEAYDLINLKRVDKVSLQWFALKCKSLNVIFKKKPHGNSGRKRTNVPTGKLHKNFGKKMSSDAKKKLSIINKNRPKEIQYKMNKGMRKAWEKRSKTLSDEHKEKISKSMSKPRPGAKGKPKLWVKGRPKNHENG